MKNFLLLLTVFVVATCGLTYELISAAAASYLLGDSITHFSLVIGVYLFAMGVGSFLSRFVVKNLNEMFIRNELLIGLIGGYSAMILYACFAYGSSFKLPLFFLVGLIGTLVGLEIPILLRVLQGRYEFRELVSNVLSFDYIGALLASVLFPLFFVPLFGLLATALIFGMINVGVALMTIILLRQELRRPRVMMMEALIVMVILMGGLIFSDKMMEQFEYANLQAKVIYAETTPYQRLILTQNKKDLRLYLNGNLQFSSLDEYRYHEALVHPGLSRLGTVKNVLILGGGDGMAAREILKYAEVESITLVDLDPAMTRVFKNHQGLVALNRGSLSDQKVKVINADAFVWLGETEMRFDFICIDFPDPSNFSLGKLYSQTFYERVKSVLSETGVMAVQCTSPYVARKSYWCIEKTLATVFKHTLAYHTLVPSFGEWGFLLAGQHIKQFPQLKLKQGELRFYNCDVDQMMRLFPVDMGKVEVEVQRLNDQVLVRYFEEEWNQ
jgi:spermidine synthase